MDGSLKIDLPGVDFTTLARQTIAAKFAEAMLGSDEVIRSIVVAAMNTKVNAQGVVGSHYDNKIPYIEWLAQDMIRSATTTVLKERVAALRPVLEKEVDKALRASTKSIAASLTESFIRNATNGYGVKVNVSAEFKEPEY